MLDLPVLRLDPDLPLPRMRGWRCRGRSPRSRGCHPAPAGGQRHPTGIAIALPEGYAGLCSRSGLAAKYGVTCLNTPGQIDSGYRGELRSASSTMIRPSRLRWSAASGSPNRRPAVAHVNFVEVDALDETEQGEQGYSSCR